MSLKRTLTLFIALVLICAMIALPISAGAAGSGSTAGLVATSSTSLTVRSSASSTSSSLTYLPKGSYVTLLSKNGSWWQVEYGAGKYGYCSSAYIQQVSGSWAAYVNISTGSLNVRSGAGSSYGILTTLTKNAGVVVLSQSAGWSKVLYSGTKIGYVSSAYLQAYGSSATYSAVSLSVPSYKQTDSRWSGTRLGSSSETIGSAGCLTTALSMTESYRTGTTITPSGLAARSSYTSGGAIYWPSNYTFSTDAGYLSTLYSMLKSGKPVLFGATGSLGQHWVVVTGYTGGSTLTASGFTINDPGSNSRTTLQQLLSSYPNFYKLAFYS